MRLSERLLVEREKEGERGKGMRLGEGLRVGCDKGGGMYGVGLQVGCRE